MSTALQAPATGFSPALVAAPTASAFALDRHTARGPFSIAAHGPVAIDAEPGLRIRVHAGCLWVPDAVEQCSVGIGAGECLEPRCAGRLHAMARRGTEVELVWPADAEIAAGARLLA